MYTNKMYKVRSFDTCFEGAVILRPVTVAQDASLHHVSLRVEDIHCYGIW